ncbi:MAG: elongation factor P [Verrucomicrobia bacterium]|nr:elongation factor P [Verrucomicrobiota bacterium]
MTTILPSEFKRGAALLLDGVPHLIEHCHTSGTAQTKPKMHARLRNLKTGRVVDRLFAENERVAVAALETRRVQFSYHQGDTFVFLDAETFDELNLTTELVGERRWFLKENEEYKALFLEGKLIGVELPDHVALKVVETAAPQRGGSQAAYKTAKLEGGLEVMVPLFIGPGELIRVDTRERKYAGKEASE